MGGSVVGRSISTKFALLKSVGDLEIIHINQLFNIALSLFWINGGTEICGRLRNNTHKSVIQHCIKFILGLMVVHLCLAALLVICYHHVHLFGSLTVQGTLEVEIVFVVVAMFCHVYSHWLTAFSCKRCFQCI